MEGKESPKENGMSEITGKTMRIRDATEGDMAFIQGELKKNNIDSENTLILTNLWWLRKTALSQVLAG